MAVLDPAAASEAEDLLAVEVAGVLEVDVLEGRRVTQLGQAARELALFVGGPLGVDVAPLVGDLISFPFGAVN